MIIAPNIAGKLPPVELVAYTAGTVPTHVPGDILLAFTFYGTPSGFTLINSGGNGNGISITTSYRIATSFSEQISNLSGGFAATLRNAGRIGGRSGVTTAQYPNGAQPYVAGFSLIDLSGNSVVLGAGNWSGNFNELYGSGAYRYLSSNGQATMFQLFSTTQNPAAFALSANGGQNFNVSAVEIATP